MTTNVAPVREEPMLDDQAETTPWALALKRLENPEPSRTSWLATVQPDGRPHLMPIIAFWIEDAFHFVVGEGTRKGRNLAADGHCVIATGSTTLPSMDVVVEGRAEPLDDEAAVGRVAKILNDNGWPLEVRGPRWTVPMPRRRGRRRTRSTGWSPRRRSACPGCSGWSSSISPSFRSRRAGRSTAPDQAGRRPVDGRRNPRAALARCGCLTVQTYFDWAGSATFRNVDD